MFGRIFGSKSQDGEGKASKANLGEASTMYYCKEKGRWRERGKEHLEPESPKIAPPPVMNKKKPEGEKTDPPLASDAPKKEVTGVDALIAPPPNPWAKRLQNNSASAPKTPGADDATQFSDKADDRTGDAADQAGGGGGAANPFATGAVVQANPFAPAFNPNAPAALKNPHMPRSLSGGQPAHRKPPSKPQRQTRTYAPVPMPSMPPTELTDPEGDVPVLNKLQPAIPNQDGVAPVVIEPPIPMPLQSLEPPLLQPPEPEQQPLPKVGNVADSLPHSGSDTVVHDAVEREDKVHDGSAGLTTPEQEPKLDSDATAEEEVISAFMTEVSQPNKPEATCDIAPVPEATSDIALVPEVPEEAASDVASVQESKPDPDLATEVEELTNWLDEVSGSKPPEHDASPEHEASSTIGEPPALPANWSTANSPTNGPAWSSMADGDTSDEAVGTAGVGLNGASVASPNPMFNASESDPMAWLADLEGSFAAVRARCADLERELEEAKRRALEREEQLLVVQKAQEERLQQMEAEAADRRDQSQATQKLQEERLHKVEAEAAEMRDQLQAERARSAAAAEASAKVAASTAAASLAEDGELPDFVQSCGNSEVIEFARRLASDNAALRRQQQQQQQPQPLQQQAVSTSAKEAIANGVAESAGHQIAPLLAVLQEKHSDLQIAMRVCVALETLTFNTAEHRVTVVKHGGLKALVELLDEHKDASGTVLRPAIDTLWNLTFEEVAVDAATEVGAIERISALMQSHRSEASLIAGACAVLLNLAVREQNRWKIVNSGSVELMASVMQQHPENEELMELGSQALYMLAYHQDLKPVVLAARGSEAAALAAACPHGAGKAQMWGRWLQEVLAC